MAQQAHILSFDDARRDTSRSASRASGAARRRQNSPLLSYLSEDDFSQPYVDDPAFLDSRSRRGKRSRKNAVKQENGRSARARRGEQAEPARATSRRRARPAADEEADRDESGRRRGAESREITAADRREARRRARAKEKAGRAFEKQFGGQAEAADGPRAAVYKGEMGANARRAQRMQAEESPAKARKSRHFGFSLSALLQSRQFMVSAIAVACMVVAVIWLYPTAQQYYCSVRNYDKLALEYEALADRNSTLQSDVDALQTDSGVEQRAHDQLGWVKKGEETAYVSGLNISSADSGSAVVANISSDSVQAPTTWYSPVLDVVFAYK